MFATKKKAAKTVIAATAVAAASAVFSPTSAMALSLTAGGVVYELDVVEGTFEDLRADLVAQPWWGNVGLSEVLAGFMLFDLGSDQSIDAGGLESRSSPAFAYGVYKNNFGPDMIVSTSYAELRIPGQGTVLFGGVSSSGIDPLTTPKKWVVESTPVPTPALLPGLVGMGLAFARKRKLAQSETA